MIARSVFEMIHSRRPASRAARRAGTVSGERLPALHRSGQRLAVVLVPAVAKLPGQLRQAVREHLAVAAVGTQEALELERLPALPQLSGGRRVALGGERARTGSRPRRRPSR